MLLHHDEFKSPLGQILFVSDDEAICSLYFDNFGDRMMAALKRRFDSLEFRRHSDPHKLKRSLRDYFDGDLHAFDSTRVITGGTPFQEQVWKALRLIPAGQTWSYGQLAACVKRPLAARAVGHANSLNPVSIIVPCHRVIGASSALVGYGGGLERKRWLLRHEGALSGTLDLESARLNAAATA